MTVGFRQLVRSRGTVGASIRSSAGERSADGIGIKEEASTDT
jgi:hypothetical protein